jgi:hypothetical protein
MPKFTIDLKQKTVDKLQAQVQRTNENQGTSYTLQVWLKRHIDELAIAEELGLAVNALQEQHQRDGQIALDAAIRSKRDELLAGQ